MRRGCNRHAYGSATCYFLKGIFSQEKQRFAIAKAKPQKHPHCGGTSKMVLGKHLHSCCRSMDEGTGYCHPKNCAIPPYGWAQKLGLSRVAQIVAFLQDWCDCKKYLPEVVMLRTTPKKAGGVSYDPKGRRRTTRPPGAACRSSLLRINYYFGGAIVGTGQGTTRRA